MKSAPFIRTAQLRPSLVIAVLLSLVACSKDARPTWSEGDFFGEMFGR